MADVTGTTATSAALGTRYAMNSGGKVSEDKTSLKNQDFLQLLIKQLQNQDPSSPMDSNAIMQQTATLSSTQTMQQMISVQQEQFSLMSRMSASSFVGQTVNYTDVAGKTQTGLVSAAAFSGTGTPTLTIGNASVSLSNVSGITAHTGTSSS
ncbi:flagellar hook capping FlgD N-terminal domain-containing protein [Quadrisphaera sp. INWT6]|uniref:flagellar hook capping FlgD N-terminal domain-containing protein n=1 Tax=Quadrisphaera sp. INWT6 TaxID=2596917 RepID=UPI0018923340|nr:flagellar hook capping FlgD N-terminal domain-containing protein [Quadrisphaera sp. INWT6]MBF5083122.1 flagellar hook capping protein [Quadrisphaera sp. INWT6]